MKYFIENLDVFVVEGENDIVIREGNNTYDSIIQYKEKEPFFMFKKRKYYLKDLTLITLETLKEKQKNNQYITPFEIEQILRQEKTVMFKGGISNNDFCSKIVSEKNRLERYSIERNDAKYNVLYEEYSDENIFETNAVVLSMLLRYGLATIF